MTGVQTCALPISNAARYQNLSINQTKLSGQCGRLKCCLNYELDTYMDALQFFPEDADMLEMERSRAFLVKKDIFKNLMWYTMPDSNKHYPLSIERVKKIKELNRQGIRPADLEPVEVVTNKPKDIEPVYADVVGQISLKSLEKTSRKRRDNEKGQQQGNRRNEQRGPQQGDNQQNRGNQQGGNQQNRGGQNQQRSNQPNQQRPNQQGGRQQQGGQQNRPQQRPPQNRSQNPAGGGQGQQRPPQSPNNNGGENK